MKPLGPVLRFDDASFRYVDESEQATSGSAEHADGRGGSVENVAFSLEPGSCVVLCGKLTRSEERRVGKECRSRWSPYH